MNTKFFITLTAVLLPIAFGPRAVSAVEPLILIVATNGTPSPDGTNRFGSLVTFADVPALNNAGQVAFATTLTGPGVGTTNHTGLFRAQSATRIGSRTEHEV